MSDFWRLVANQYARFQQEQADKTADDLVKANTIPGSRSLTAELTQARERIAVLEGALRIVAHNAEVSGCHSCRDTCLRAISTTPKAAPTCEHRWAMLEGHPETESCMTCGAIPEEEK